jgi:hypothetical protein
MTSTSSSFLPHAACGTEKPHSGLPSARTTDELSS